MKKRDANIQTKEHSFNILCLRREDLVWVETREHHADGYSVSIIDKILLLDMTR